MTGAHLRILLRSLSEELHPLLQLSPVLICGLIPLMTRIEALDRRKNRYHSYASRCSRQTCPLGGAVQRRAALLLLA